ncbi:MAG TPA: response regulator transcription factor [Ignavibacteriaceae bacterium]|nr:response regulator transcription factor [Ignavibacteriaceae bacterium]
MGQLSVYILSSFPALTEGIKTFLASNDIISICGCSDHFNQTFDSLIRIRPDILFVDDVFFDKSQIADFLKELPKAFTSTKLIVYTNSNDPIFLKKLVHSGVLGVLHKKSHQEEIINAIMIVGIGKVFIDKEISSIILNYEIRLKTFNDSYLQKLSDREIEVLEYIYIGLSNKEIALQLNISIRTVEKHKDRIKNKVGLSSVKDLYHYLNELSLQD